MDHDSLRVVDICKSSFPKKEEWGNSTTDMGIRVGIRQLDEIPMRDLDLDKEHISLGLRVFASSPVILERRWCVVLQGLCADVDRNEVQNPEWSISAAGW